jgi:hypothetical protein
LDRVIDLSKYYPSVVKDTENFKEIAETENPEFNLVNSKINDVLSDQYVEDATENGIKRYENIIKIYPKASDTLEDRKTAILLKYNFQLPYTYRTLENKLIAIYGGNGYNLELLNDEYILDIEILSNNWSLFDTVVDNFRKILPCNLVLKSTMINKVFSELFIGSVHLMGEEITIYPYSAKELENRVSLNIKISQDASAETITTYPKGGI